MKLKGTIVMLVLCSVLLASCQTTNPNQSTVQSSNIEQIVSGKLDQSKATLIELEKKGIKSSAPLEYAKLTKLLTEADTLIQINAYDELEPLLSEFNQIVDSLAANQKAVDPNSEASVSKSKAVSNTATREIPKTYKIKSGDTLYSLAIRFYKDPNKWKGILNANSDSIRSPSEI